MKISRTKIDYIKCTEEDKDGSESIRLEGVELKRGHASSIRDLSYQQMAVKIRKYSKPSI